MITLTLAAAIVFFGCVILYAMREAHKLVAEIGVLVREQKDA